ncbi:MAG: PaaI family thioesterase [Planctomycetota bacterium]|nr:MAG: PaaI family thioesterase [Planctomycetota bacterium]
MSDSASTPDPLEKERRVLMEFFPKVPFMKLMGFEMLDVGPGHARLSMNWREDLCQPAGILHGGALSSLVDTAIAQAILLTSPYHEMKAQGAWIVTLDLRLKFLRPVSSGKIFCDAKVIRAGRRVIHADAVVVDEHDKQVVLGDSMYMIVAGEQLEKREG